MSILASLYAEDDDLLREVADILKSTSAKASDPAEVEAPGSLDIDLATTAHQFWELLVVFGSVKASLEALELIIKILRDRKTKGRTAKLELAGPRNSKLVLEGSMTPEEIKEAIKKYQEVLLEEE